MPIIVTRIPGSVRVVCPDGRVGIAELLFPDGRVMIQLCDPQMNNEQPLCDQRGQELYIIQPRESLKLYHPDGQ